MENITYSEMVKSLTKNGSDILDDLTPESIHILHMAVGIAGEAGELCKEIYIGNESEENIIEECGDLEFYIEGLLQSLNPIYKINKINVLNDTFYALAVKLNIESSILLDMIKKNIFYNKIVDVNKTVNQIKIIHNLMLNIYLDINVERSEILKNNMKKLSKRYKNYEFTNVQAIKRNDKNETIS